ncbi:LIM domain-containing protein WLIM1-like [Nicotiana sylvestris]|uniref:LIM domain-containing protein WLIM1-like n=1 Tax=Nicotiana sylvestris TaxID=4096 RepID=UPI00388C755D
MATFGGTTQKCKGCEKTVYLVDQLTADNKVYHKACFRCHHCKGTLKLSNYNSFEGVLYCRPHFDQLFKMTGSLDKSFEGAPKTVRERSADQGQSNSKVSSLFGGTQDKCVSLCKKELDQRPRLCKGPFSISEVVNGEQDFSYLKSIVVLFGDISFLFLCLLRRKQKWRKNKRRGVGLLLMKSLLGNLKEKKGSNGPIYSSATKMDDMIT